MHSTKVVGEYRSGAGRPGWREEEGVGDTRSRLERGRATLVGKMTSNEQGELILEGTMGDINYRLVSK